MTQDKLNEILRNLRLIESGGSVKPCVCVHGTQASGKTVLLKKLRDDLMKADANVFFALSKEDDGALRELLRQLARLFGENHDPEFIKFVMSYAKGSLASDSESGSVELFEKDSLAKFIYFCLKTEPCIFIVDDADKADSYTINLLNSLLCINAMPLLIISHSDTLNNKELSDMLYSNCERITYVSLEPPLFEIPEKPESDTFEIDEAMLILTKPGREAHLIKRHMNNARQHLGQMAYEKACQAFNAALDVPQNLTDRNEISTAKTEILINLGEVQLKDKQFVAALYTFQSALQAAEASKEPPDKRALIFNRLADCYNELNDTDMVREQIMLTEAFFCTTERRSEFYDLYANHISKYLYLLIELGETVIFNEKLRQANDICRKDDSLFASTLNCEESCMYMQNEDFVRAYEKLVFVREMAEKSKNRKVWDEVTNSMAICAEHMGNSKVSLNLWNELMKTSHDPVKVAGAMVNIAVMDFEQTGNAEKAIAEITKGIELCIVAGETRIASEIHENLKDTPLAIPV